MATNIRTAAFRNQTLFWLIFLVFFIGLVVLLKDVLPPFITGMAIAYLLNPSVTKLDRILPRWLASLLILISFAIFVVIVFVAFSPMIAHQIINFINDVPSYIEKLRGQASPYIDQFLSRLHPDDVERIREAAGNQAGAVLTGAKKVISSVWSSGMAVIDIITFLVIVPVVAFYCLRDWPTITKKVDRLFPRRHAKTLRSIFREFDTRLAGFMRGQLLVCICLGCIYGFSLTAIGLNFGLAIGFMAGILSFVPYVGSTFGFVASVGVSLVQYEGYEMPLIVVGIFVLGQLIEGNFLTPKLVGERIGLHAVWVIFALMTGGNLFGFTGLLLAVPVAALIGVLVRHAMNWYEKSPAYLGQKKA